MTGYGLDMPTKTRRKKEKQRKNRKKEKKEKKKKRKKKKEKKKEKKKKREGRLEIKGNHWSGICFCNVLDGLDRGVAVPRRIEEDRHIWLPIPSWPP